MDSITLTYGLLFLATLICLVFIVRAHSADMHRVTQEFLAAVERLRVAEMDPRAWVAERRTAAPNPFGLCPPPRDTDPEPDPISELEEALAHKDPHAPGFPLVGPVMVSSTVPQEYDGSVEGEEK